ncbi:MAG: zinc-ribbon domain-containing protein, partial [Desulfotomaculaceae bacterium]|nr:zinc-ribbon domain-containing protein [Desulfotomaculaceae bacterium]
MQCPNCQKALQEDFKFCPYCGTEMVKNFACHTCHKQVEPAWVSCPHCGSDLKRPVQRPIREQPTYRQEQQHQPPYDHGHYYGSSSSRHSRKRKGFLGRLFS